MNPVEHYSVSDLGRWGLLAAVRREAPRPVDGRHLRAEPGGAGGSATAVPCRRSRDGAPLALAAVVPAAVCVLARQLFSGAQGGARSGALLAADMLRWRTCSRVLPTVARG